MCYLNAPLKIIFLFANWNKKKEEIIDSYWSGIIEAFESTIGIIGTIGVFILDVSNNEVNYYYHLLVENGKYVEQTKNPDFCKMHIMKWEK